MNLLSEFEKFIRENCLVSRNEKLLLGVSGGVDSVVLLNLFLIIKNEWNLSISVAHLNHMLRGRYADRDEFFVRDIARQWGVAFYSRRADVREFSRTERCSIEEGARRVRFEFLNDILSRIGYDNIALGHQANDQAETVVMNLLRGSGIRGLRGIRPRSGRVIHPLLFATREMIEEHAHRNNLPYVEDATNKKRHYMRNRIRLDIVKRMEKVMGSHIIKGICRSSISALEVEELLEKETEVAWKSAVSVKSSDEIILDINRFLGYLKAVQKYILIRIIETIFFHRQIRSFEIDRIYDLICHGKSGSRVILEKGFMAVRSGDTVAFIKRREPFRPVNVRVNGSVTIKGLGLRITTSLIEWRGNRIPQMGNPDVELFDYDKLSFPLVLRSYRMGDRFYPLGMRGKKKLKEFFIDSKIPVYYRSSVPLLTSGEDIVWIVGHRIDERFRITEETRRALKIMVQKIDQ